ncbi:MAG: carotenoid 1,2-hydratase, partial [Longimicrobiales bacterium]|nr:carotenoid 1,2-hydratase [Longimicrobiales bacterium]
MTSLRRRRWGRSAVGILGAAGVVAAGWAAFSLLRAGGSAGGREEVRATLDLAEAMGGADTAGYARATAPRPFVFPDDHGPHPAFRTEWWYVTANLDGPGGRRFGVHFTLFRNALGPEPGAGSSAGFDPDAADAAATATGAGSAWSTRQVYMGHFAVTDVAGDAFHEAERFTRAAAGLAGGTADPLRIWMDDWSLTGGGEPDPDAPEAGAVFPL